MVSESFISFGKKVVGTVDDIDGDSLGIFTSSSLGCSKVGIVGEMNRGIAGVTVGTGDVGRVGRSVGISVVRTELVSGFVVSRSSMIGLETGASLTMLLG